VLANAGERYRLPRTLTLIAGGTLASACLLLGGLLGSAQLLRYALGLVSPNDFRDGELILVPVAAAGALGLLYLWPPIQRALAGWLPIRPGSPVVYLTIVLGLILIALQIGTKVQPQEPLTYSDLLAQDIPLLVLSFAGVGIFVRRSPPQAVERLGLQPPTDSRWWLVALAGIGVFIGVAFGIEAIANLVAPAQEKEVTDVSNLLFSHFNNPGAIIFLGVLAGVVEETLFRGALLPRLGVVVSSILFAALHTQYAVSFATLEVFVLGLGLGWLRVQAKSTLPCMVTHAGYDIAVGLLPYVFK
jgi:membrane protease YdiL (CAAX protease family)